MIIKREVRHVQNVISYLLRPLSMANEVNASRVIGLTVSAESTCVAGRQVLKKPARRLADVRNECIVEENEIER